ncbi:MAG TPA: hypothetical protein VEA80_12360 [Vitreimonas sp.]|uniref:hypothetical protein n=1 Tax=Vitreimonas sp. TaxID=3069702 RepID=UPI002D32C19E|nr:hypothetical protein [Vitreimonas sp.]HYD88264.1 hypothetical protein [Vitreimonas sp.]
MVTSIHPGAAGVSTLGADTRFAKPHAQQRRDDAAPSGDRVDLSSASLASARDSVREALSQVHTALALGQDAQAVLVKAQELWRTGGEAAQAELSALLGGFAQRIEAAIAGGARVAAGESVSVQAEPGAAPVEVAGVDLRPGEGVALGADASVADPTLPEAAQRSLEKLQDAMNRLLDSARALEAHQGFLGAVQGGSIRHDLDADGARLLALQVRQGLEASGGGAIANVEPQAVLALFRA